MIGDSVMSAISSALGGRGMELSISIRALIRAIKSFSCCWGEDINCEARLG